MAFWATLAGLAGRSSRRGAVPPSVSASKPEAPFSECLQRFGFEVWTTLFCPGKQLLAIFFTELRGAPTFRCIGKYLQKLGSWRAPLPVIQPTGNRITVALKNVCKLLNAVPPRTQKKCMRPLALSMSRRLPM